MSKWRGGISHKPSASMHYVHDYVWGWLSNEYVLGVEYVPCLFAIIITSLGLLSSCGGSEGNSVQSPGWPTPWDLQGCRQ